MMTDLLTPLGATMEQVVTAVAVVGCASAAAMGAWEWFHARVVADWDREHRRRR